MRNLNFLSAGLMCVVAVWSKLVGNPIWMSIVLLIAAAMILVGAFAQRAREKRLKENPVVLSEEQRAEVLRLKGEGREIVAIKQVRLWYRDLDLKGAKEIVDGI